MNTATIEKAIKLLNEGDIIVLGDLLRLEYEKSVLQDNGKKANVLTAVKRFIEGGKKNGYGETLYGIMRSKDGKQAVCNGYVLVKWKNEKNELNALPQIPETASIDVNHLLDYFNGIVGTALSESDKIVLKNIDKFIKLNKDKRVSERFIEVEFGGRIFDAKMLKDLVDIIGTDDITLYIPQCGYNLKVETPEAEAEVCGLRLDEPERKTVHKNTQDFIDKILARN